MGKRKERRLAALNNTGRRVKLDLFAESSGDLGGSSVHDEVGGGDSDPTQRAGLPNSPSSSSSGQQPQNPLLLLGQYSDDELDEGKDKNLNKATNNSPSADLSKQDIHPAEGNDKDSNAVQDPAIQSNEQQDMDADSTGVDVVQSAKGFDYKDYDTVHDDTSKPFMSAEQASEGGVSTLQVAADVSLGWRMVLHEESNQYYYWNPGTGETSWEVPIALAQMGYAVNLEASIAEDTVNLPLGKGQNDSVSGVELAHSCPTPTIDGLVGVSCAPLSKEAHSSMQQMYVTHQQAESEPSQSESLATHLHQNEVESYSVSVRGQSGEEDAVHDDHRHVAVATDIGKEGDDTSTSLRTQCQCLLERLKSLKGFDRRPQDREQILKYIIELETRLSDIESLSSYGLTLLPFWMHSEGRLKQLEDKINSEIYQLAVSAQMDDDVEPTAVICEGKQQHQDGLFRESPADEPRISESPSIVNVMGSSHIEGACDSVAYDVRTSPSEAAAIVSETTAMSAEVNGTAELKPDLIGIEDVDMDIDMEVEDVNTAPSENNLDTNSAPSEQFLPSNAPVDYTFLAAGESSAVVPLPPEEEWIPPPPPDTEHVPPPPPDDEQVPPLPPDEPPDSSYSMLTCSGPMVHQASYTDQYGYPYMDFQYYGSASTLPSGSFYVHADGSQVAIPHTSLYYGPVSTTYVGTPPVMVNPVEQVASYNHLQTVPPGTLPTGLESSNLPTNVGTVQSDSSYILNAVDSVEAGQYVKPEPPSSVNSQVPDVSNDEGTVSATSVNVLGAAAAASAPSTNAKVQSKGSRGKKRTVAISTSMRSNKKVSSLVDKWKAAKEELKETDEDEPENALEILEKKRQREIEEWRAKQITSGEARDNANFQPLGGDWREKVKRRRALAAKEEAKKAAEVAAVDTKQQPDLKELSKGLPSGWQVYWDEASKQVYYGNAVTSETSWTKPTN